MYLATLYFHFNIIKQLVNMYTVHTSKNMEPSVNDWFVVFTCRLTARQIYKTSDAADRPYKIYVLFLDIEISEVDRCQSLSNCILLQDLVFDQVKAGSVGVFQPLKLGFGDLYPCYLSLLREKGGDKRDDWNQKDNMFAQECS